MTSSVDFSHVDVMNRALFEVRARPIVSIDDDDQRTEAVISAYYTMIDHLLTARKWHFSRTGLTRLTAGALSGDELQGWANNHVLPADRISPPIKIVRDQMDDKAIRFFELTGDGRHILSDEPVLFGWFARRGEPANWPGYFRALAVTAVAARYAAIIRNDAGIAAAKMAEAFGSNSMAGQGGLLKQAGDLDHAARPPEDVTAGDAFVANRTRQGDDGCHYMKF